VELDEQLRGNLPQRVLRKYHIETGTEVAIEQQLADKLNDEIYAYAWNKLLNWLASQERSIGESRQFLKKNYIAPDLIDQLIQKAESADYLNDERYAELLIEYLAEKGKSFFEVKNKMMEKHLSTSLIESKLQEHYDPEKQRQVLESEVKKLSEIWQLYAPENRKKKISKRLLRRGYNFHEIEEFFYKYNEDATDDS
jgi:SOS response regulatory protein OraA/RecX